MEDRFPISARRLKFGLPKDLPRHWNGNCPIKTHLFNAIAILAPTFERLAISSVLPFRDKITGHLQEQVLGFIGQESAHGSEFIRYNQILKHLGYDIKKLEKHNIKKFKWISDKLSQKMHLSLTLAAEHLTAIISDQILREKIWLQESVPAMRALWRWHAIEEIEHKAVVFDLYQAIGGGYFLRIMGMCLVTAMLGNLLIRNFFHLLLQDKLFFKGSTWIKLIKTFLWKPGFLRRLILPYLHYYLPRFHPWRQNNLNLIVPWKSRLSALSPLEMVQLLHNELSV